MTLYIIGLIFCLPLFAYAEVQGNKKKKRPTGLLQVLVIALFTLCWPIVLYIFSFKAVTWWLNE